MVRKLKHHEEKLLKKVDFYDWEQDNGHKETLIMQRYHIQNRNDYSKYHKLCGEIRRFALKLTELDARDPVRLKHEKLMLEKLESMGVLGFGGRKAKVSDLEGQIIVSNFCRRRIPVVMWRLKMAPSIRDATLFVEQGHVRVGPQVITDPAFLVTKKMEDYLTWVDESKIKRNIAKYRQEVDDFLL
ncbi:uncharacterized protein SAPINGB_P005416 [Magnusiomyces paraingens]|uniref:U3 small nucleolar ribonucleoprotein protein IMP3 n=1 Tax=Magnusiomyces paraingens TaxID=2606893 RepID=A0A5E8BZ69_9ASCO|nr:uncharacterized protein SAPINGB_P005416 [Saprochaete ingens]VVT56929.1 unnamed protein product [Saprochaete ingens]